MKIHSKRGVWYVTEPDHPVRRFDSEEAAMAYVNGEEPNHAEPIVDNDDVWADLV
jgi:hypothetical protein